MDLIYTDANRIDQGVLSAYSFDLSFGKSENDFEITLGADEPVLDFGAFVYIEGTEYGGIVDGRKTSTDSETITYTGRTWHGMLNSKVIVPLKGGEAEASKKLPEGYTKLAYIESSGKQYIDTGVKPNPDTRAVADVQFLEFPTTHSAVFGSGDSTNLWWAYYRYSDSQYRAVNGGTAQKSIAYADPTARTVLDLQKGTFSAGDNAVAVEATDFSIEQTIYLFALNRNDAVNYPAAFKMYSCQIYDNGTLVRDFVPCMNADGNIGLYDIVNGVFHGNSGTGTFTAGDVIETKGYAVTLETVDAKGASLVDRYFDISGEANVCIGYILERIGLAGLFEASSNTSGVIISKYQFHRYCKGYEGLKAMLEASGAKLNIEWKDGVICLSANPLVDYTEAPVDGDTATLTVEQYGQRVNHLICLGRGELEEREIIHLYVDASGNISDAQYYTGVDEFIDVYDNSSVESSEDLRNGGIERLKELRGNDTAEISIKEDEVVSYDIGDIVGASEIRSGVRVAATVVQKIVRINNGAVHTDYQTGG